MSEIVYKIIIAYFVIGSFIFIKELDNFIFEVMFKDLYDPKRSIIKRFYSSIILVILVLLVWPIFLYLKIKSKGK